jgi:hypothetical protein
VRHVILHYHIFKNAGTSVDASLSSSFGPAWHNYDRDPRWTNITSADLLDHLRLHPDLRALSSHQARWPEPSAPDLVVHPVVFLRHPIDRVGSIYAYEARIGGEHAAGRSLAEYVDWLLSPEGGIVACSFQTLFLSDDDHLTQPPLGPNTVAGPEHLATATARLERLAAFGVVERFEESVALLGRRLAPDFPELDLTVRRENTSGERGSTLAGRLDQLAEALGRRRARRLARANEADLELWHRAGQLFGERIGEAPGRRAGRRRPRRVSG